MSGALEGVTVIDLTWSWAGGLSTRLLADLGADVLRIEGVVRPDWTRFLCYKDNEPGNVPWDRGGYFQDLNHSKQSVVLNLYTESARELLLRLIDQADVFVESFAPRVTEGWGLSFERLHARNPRLVMASLTGFGQSGPWRDYSVFGPTMESMSGVTSLGGVDGAPPERIGVFYGDPITGCSTAAAIVTALYEARITGQGQYIDVAGTEAVMSLVGEAYVYAQQHGEPPPRVAGDLGAAFSGSFPAVDGEWVCLSCRDEAQVRAAANALGVPAGQSPADGIPARIRALSSSLAVEALQRAGIPVSRILDTADLIADPHLEARGLHFRPEHGAVGDLLNTGSVFRSSPSVARPLGETRPSPLYGEHTKSVLQSRIGITDTEWHELLAEAATAIIPSQELLPPPAPIAAWRIQGLIE